MVPLVAPQADQDASQRHHQRGECGEDRQSPRFGGPHRPCQHGAGQYHAAGHQTADRSGQGVGGRHFGGSQRGHQDIADDAFHPVEQQAERGGFGSPEQDGHQDEAGHRVGQQRVAFSRAAIGAEGEDQDDEVDQRLEGGGQDGFQRFLEVAPQLADEQRPGAQPLDTPDRARLWPRPAPAAWLASSLQFIARGQHAEQQSRQRRVDRQHDRDADRQRAVGVADEAVAEAVDHVEERVEVRQPARRRRQPVDRIEGAGQEGQRRDDEIGHRRDVVELLRPDAADDAEQRQQQRGQRPWNRTKPGRMDVERHEDRTSRRRSPTPTNSPRVTPAAGEAERQLPAARAAASARRRCCPGPWRSRMRRGRVGEGVLRHRHHDQARRQELEERHAPRRSARRRRAPARRRHRTAAS